MNISRKTLQKEQWCLLKDDWTIEKFIPADEIKESDKSTNPRLYCIHPEKILVKVPYIRVYTFAPSTAKAWATLQQIHWDQYDNPAVVWQYFKLALWCWNTPRSHFASKIASPKTAKETLAFWKQSAEYSTWREISYAKESDSGDDHVIVFTEKLFKKGLSTLINVIIGFLAQKEQQLTTTFSEQHTLAFELFMYRGQLWIAADSVTGKEKFCVQKFKDSGYAGGSEQEKFCKTLVETTNEPYQLAFENVSHVFDRLKLPKIIKKLFFGAVQGSSVYYSGPQLTLNREMSDIKLISKSLHDVHKYNDSPSFISNET